MGVGVVDIFGCTGLLTVAILMLYFGRTAYNNDNAIKYMVLTGIGSFCLIALSIIMTSILKGVH